MDDPLSALDAHVKKRVFDWVFCWELEGRTRILVTHALDCLPKVDRIIIMNKGTIDYDGVFEDLIHTEYYQNIKGNLDSSHMKESFSSDAMSVEVSLSMDEKDNSIFEEEKQPISWKSYLSSRGTEIIVKENKEDVPITWKTYSSYYFYTGWIGVVFIATLLVTCIGHGSWVFYEYNLLYWAQDLSLPTPSNDREGYLIKFLIFTGISGVFLILSNYFIYLYGGLIASKLFRDINNRIFHAPINKYFDITP